jgi:DNA polymerase delta subunit 1
MAKDDVTPQDIFRLTKGTAADRARVAKYCIQDCNLVHHLMNKVDVLTGYVEMSSICSVPISFLVFRGQGIKLTSYVAKKCRVKDTLMPDLEKSGGNEGYEGAIVLPPKCSMYMDNPVACVDYASLYPSSMISQNFSHDSKVWTREYDLEGNLLRQTGEIDRNTGKYRYDELPGYEYIDIEFDTFRYVRKTPTSAAVKTKCGKKVCRWAQFPDNRKGIMPSILEELLKARSDTRKKGKTEPDPFMQNVLDKRQLGYKVTANSLYGQCGAKTSSFYEKDVAASTTATGRMMIIYARRIIEEVYGNRE